MKFPKHLMVSVLPIKHIIEIPNGIGTNVVVEGVEGRFLRTLSKALNFSYTLVIPKDKQWGSVTPSGNWTGMIGMVQRNEADIAISAIGVTKDRIQVVDFSPPYLESDITFVTNLPDLLPKAYAFLRTFDTVTWILISSLLLIMPLLFYKIFNYSYNKMFFFVFANMLGMSSSVEIYRQRILMACWWFTSVFLSLSFAAVMPSFLSLPLTYPAVSNFKKLAKAIDEEGYEAYITSGTYHVEALRTQSLKHMVRIADEIDRNNWFLLNGLWLNGQNIEKKTAIMFGRPFLQLNYGIPDLAGKLIGQDGFAPVFAGIAVNKDFCCKSIFDSVVVKIFEAGIYKKYFEDQVFKSCLTTYTTVVEEHHDIQLTTNDITIALIVLFSGYFLSSCILFIEIFWHRKIYSSSAT